MSTHQQQPSGEPEGRPDRSSTELDPQSSFSELSRIMLGNQPLDDVLHRVAELAARTVPGVAEVSVTLVENDRPRNAAFTGPLAAALDERQYESGFGPCLDAAATGDTIILEDVGSDDRYPDFTAEAARRGVTRIMSVGMPIPQRTVGALNMYTTTPGPLEEDAVRIAQTFSGYAAVALANAALFHSTADLAKNLQTAMQSRSVIEQAKGVLMSQHHCTADRAFAMLSEASQRANRKVRDIAQGIVDGIQE
jgi:GAF domain-containing protein